MSRLKTPAHDKTKPWLGLFYNSDWYSCWPLSASCRRFCRGGEWHFSSVSVVHQFRADGAMETNFCQN